MNDPFKATWNAFPDPETTFDNLSYKREWIHPEPLQYYLYEDKGKMWTVIDRTVDLAIVGKYKTKRGAISAFRRKFCQK